jgi:Ca-activated chloride channel family protein
VLRRKKKMAVRYANLSLVKAAMGQTPAWHRHLPAALLLASLTIMIAGIARPVAVITLPSQQKTIILAMDVSGSMRASDVEPTRMAAAQAAAKAFVKEQPRSTRIGVVAFGGAAMMVQSPTQSHDDIFAAIDRFQYQRGTNIGGGIVLSLQTLFPDAEIELKPPAGSAPPRNGAPPRGQALNSGPAERQPMQPVDPGSYQSGVIILLTDGRTTTGPDPIQAARLVAQHGVRIFSVGFGTPQGATIDFEGWSARVQLDEETLRQVAELTRGAYFSAGSEAQLNEVYKTLSAKFSLERKETEITSLFSAAAAVMAVIAALLSLLWFGRII